jgi:thioredoxin-like negative regulator of GroEL
MLPVNMILLLGAAAIAWWLSGFDLRVTGENRKTDLIRRVVRCAATAVLAGIFFGFSTARLGYFFVPLIMIVPVSLGLLWCGCLAEFFSHGFHRLISSDDRHTFNPNQSARNMDMVAHLLKNGRHEEAVQLCAALKKSGDASILVLETLLARSGIQMENDRKPRPLAEAYHLRSQEKFGEAEAVLNSLLAENPSDVDAALMLMRLYAQDLRRSDKAAKVLRALEKQPQIPDGHIEYAQRSIHDWGRKKSAPKAVALPESVDELLACGYLGTAIEVLERKVNEQPQDFDLSLKLAEAHGLHSSNVRRAEKIVQSMESSNHFSAAQIEIAKVKLKEWHAAMPQQN